MGKPGWGYHYTPCNSGGGGAGPVVALLILGGLIVGAAGQGASHAVSQAVHVVAVALEVVAITAVSVAALLVVYGMARVTLWARRRLAARTAPASLPAPAVTVAVEASSAPQRALEGRVVVTGSAATVPMSPARQTAGRREWQRER